MNSQSKKMELLGSASIPKALLAMGIPTMIGMLVNAFYNLVDAYFVGGLGESQMGGNLRGLSARTGCCRSGSVVWQRCCFLYFPIVRSWGEGKC